MNTLLPSQAIEFSRSLIMAVLDGEGRYTYVSPPWERAIGVCAKDAISRHVWDIVPGTHAREAMRTGETIVAQSIQAQGVPLFTTYIPIKDENGAVKGLYLFTVFNGMNEALAMTDRIRELTNEVSYYQKELSRERGARYTLDSIIGQSDAVQEMKHRIQMAARSHSTVLIEGETGTGKELIAHSVHTLSLRRAENFVRVNCAAIPTELMESEFFGYAGGAFTGADKKGKRGKFLLANNGSLFLDEVNLLPPTMQPKFLRVLQEREIDPVGGDRSIPVNVRVIAAANTALEQLVADGKFREDLYYRLNVVSITAPPLRERKEDIPLLAKHFVRGLCRQMGMMVVDIEPAVIEMMFAYSWPGNIREMRNIIESSLNETAGPTLREKDCYRLRERLKKKEPAPAKRFAKSLKQSKSDLERQILVDALQAHGGNKKRAAEALGISRQVFYDKLKKHGI